MYIDEQVVELPQDAPPPVTEQPQRASGGPWPWVGALAIGLAVLAAAVQIIAISTASAGDFETGIVLGYLAVVIAIAAVLAGVAAIVLRRGRRAGVVGIVLGLVANPLVLLGILRLFDGTKG
jgi:uncharacterized membrane protein